VDTAKLNNNEAISIHSIMQKGIASIPEQHIKKQYYSACTGCGYESEPYEINLASDKCPKCNSDMIEHELYTT